MIHQLEADGIGLGFGTRKILSSVYIKCETGKITGLLGRNGQGKSCLMNIISGTLKATSSSVRVDGIARGNLIKRPDVLLYLPQFNFIPGSLKVAQVLKDFCIDKKELERRFPAFEGRYELKVGQLSGGQWRTLEIFVIVKKPSLFAMLDEPFTHLNPLQTDEVKDFLLAEKVNKGLMITDHMYDHLLDVSDCTWLLKDGCTHSIKSVDDLARLGYVNLP